MPHKSSLSAYFTKQAGVQAALTGVAVAATALNIANGSVVFAAITGAVGIFSASQWKKAATGKGFLPPQLGG